MKRLPLIRHLRYFYHSRRMVLWYNLWSNYGYVGPAQSDLDILDAIWRGDC